MTALPGSAVRSRSFFLFAAAATLALAGGCASRQSAPTTENSSLAERPRSAQSSDPSATNDAAFLGQMIAHCDRDRQLADSLLSKGGRSSVLAVAEQIRAHRINSIEFLRTEQARLGIKSVPIVEDITAHTTFDDRRMNAMSASDANDFFVSHLIKHNLEMSRLANQDTDALASANLRYYAKSVLEDSTRELRELRAVECEPADVPQSARAGKTGQSYRR